jgi:hypothetical protein
VKSEPGPADDAAAQVRLIVWCRKHQVEPDPAEIAARYGVGTSVLDWRERLVCSGCGRAQKIIDGDANKCSAERRGAVVIRDLR